jgi:hypothetical protein
MRAAHLFGPSTSSGTQRPLKGILRLVNKVFTDDSGPRRVFFASFFAALRVLRDRPSEFARELDSIAAAGYQGVRVFWAVGGFNGFWGGAEVVPVSFTQDNGNRLEAWPDYDVLFVKLLKEVHSRGLRLALTTGDIEYVFPDPNVELSQHQRIASLVASNGGANIVSSWEVRNEWYVNSPHISDDENFAQMRRVARAVKAILPDVLVSTSNIDAGQDPSQFERAIIDSDIVHVHGMRSPGERAIDRALHCIAWGEGQNQYRPYGVWQMEPASAICDHGGCTDPILSHAALQSLYAIHQITGQPSSFFQGNAVTPTSTPLSSVWGFKEFPALFNTYFPEDIATWNHGFHHVGSILWWFNDKQAITVTAEGWDYTPAVPLQSSTVIIGDTIHSNVTDLSSVLTPGFEAAIIIGTRS